MIFGNIDNMFQVVLDGDDIIVTSPAGIKSTYPAELAPGCNGELLILEKRKSRVKLKALLDDFEERLNRLNPYLQCFVESSMKNYNNRYSYRLSEFTLFNHPLEQSLFSLSRPFGFLRVDKYRNAFTRVCKSSNLVSEYAPQTEYEEFIQLPLYSFFSSKYYNTAANKEEYRKTLEGPFLPLYDQYPDFLQCKLDNHIFDISRILFVSVLKDIRLCDADTDDLRYSDWKNLNAWLDLMGGYDSRELRYWSYLIYSNESAWLEYKVTDLLKIPLVFKSNGDWYPIFPLSVRQNTEYYRVVGDAVREKGKVPDFRGLETYLLERYNIDRVSYATRMASLERVDSNFIRNSITRNIKGWCEMLEHWDTLEKLPDAWFVSILATPDRKKK